MWRRVARLGILAAFAATSAATATAEPIQAVYRIDVFRQCTYANDAEACRDYSASFPLTVSFDSGVTIGYGDDSDRVRFYGAPTFSGVPLPRREDFPALRETLRVAAERGRFSEPDGAWLRESDISVRFGATVDGSDFHRDFGLHGNGAFPFVPALDALSFSRFLGTADFRQFSFSDSILLASGGFESLTYYGRSSLESPVVTPEPASVLLVLTGIVALWRGRRRAVRADSSPHAVCETDVHGACHPQSRAHREF